jgi:hypothetical protein
VRIKPSKLPGCRSSYSAIPPEIEFFSLLDFYNELGAAVRGRLEGANTIARVNDALRDVFEVFVLEPPPHVLGEGIFVIPVLRVDGHTIPEWLDGCGDLGRCITEHVSELEPITPPLRRIHAPSPELANTWV